MREPAFIHLRRTDNIGDLSSCPAEGWEEYDDCPRLDMSEVDRLPRSMPIIVGGGGLLWKGGWKFILEHARKRPVIVWGVGLNHSDESEAQDETGLIVEALNNCLLAGLRNLDFALKFGFEFVPCASCMNPLFEDFRRMREHSVEIQSVLPMTPLVTYEHKDRRFAFRGVPSKTNRAESLNDVLSFLMGADRVVTNSFHGAYWSLLLGCRVTLWDPGHFGTRFSALLLELEQRVRTVRQAKESAGVSLPGYFKECVDLNQNFKKQVDAALKTL